MRSLQSPRIIYFVSIIAYAVAFNNYHATPRLNIGSKLSPCHFHQPSVVSPFNSVRLDHTRLLSQSYSTLDVQNAQDTTSMHGWLSISPKWKKILKNFVLITIPFLLFLAIYNLSPVLAKEVAKKGSKSAAVATKKAVTNPPPLWKKLLEGANTKGTFKTWKAGDTRTEFSALLNSAGSVVILGGFTLVAYIRHKQIEFSQSRAFKREQLKAQEYKENMYFDAVDDILKKLDDPNLKSGGRQRLQKELNELDPDGVIQDFVRNGGPRPDISNLLDKNSKSKPAKKRESSSKDTSKPLSSKSPEISSKSRTASPSSKPSSGNKSNKKDSVFEALNDSLLDVFSEKQRKKLIDYLKLRVESMKDPAKKDGALAKIAEKLGDEDYWKEFYSRFNEK